VAWPKKAEPGPASIPPPGWAFVTQFRCPPAETAAAWSWSAAAELVEAARGILEVLRRELTVMLERWDAALRDLGGDPSRRDWLSFRPLRLTREEDWSDWLAHLMGDSRRGGFHRALFDGHSASALPALPPTTLREIPTDEGHRCDILLEWPTDGVHIEVKVGDRNFAKTVPTARAIQRLRPTVTRHVLLVPDGDAADATLDSSGPSGPQIAVLTWTEVARALRKCLRDPEQDLAWKAWAVALCGAVEQRILQLPCLGSLARSEPATTRSLAAFATYLNLLEFGDG